MNRERVIVDIVTLGQALKVEQTIRTGYCDPIAENIAQWIAVEEDLANSYDKLSTGSTRPELKKYLSELEEESRRNLTFLHSLLKSVEDLGEARIRREKLVERLMKST
jgi:rubrerythrin